MRTMRLNQNMTQGKQPFMIAALKNGGVLLLQIANVVFYK